MRTFPVSIFLDLKHFAQLWSLWSFPHLQEGTFELAGHCRPLVDFCGHSSIKQQFDCLKTPLCPLIPHLHLASIPPRGRKEIPETHKTEGKCNKSHKALANVGCKNSEQLLDGESLLFGEVKLPPGSSRDVILINTLDHKLDLSRTVSWLVPYLR